MSVCRSVNKLFSIILNQQCRSVHLMNSCTQPKYCHELSIMLRKNIHTSKYFSAIVSYNLTDIGEGIREVAVKEWYVKVGDKVSQFDNICEVQSDKASVTITSRYDGIIKKLYYNIDDTALVGKPLVDIEAETDEETVVDIPEKVEEKTSPASSSSTHDEIESSNYKRTLCIPSVRRLAKEYNINLLDLKGTGKGGRVLKEDVLKYLQLDKKVITPMDKKIDASNIENDRIEPIRGFRKAMVKTMTEALKIPHFVYFDEISTKNLSKIRISLKEEAQKLGFKITMMPFFIKAASNALVRYPILNAHMDKNCESFTYKSAHNIGIAMDTAVGLAVPVIKNVEKLDILQISQELNRLMKSGKEGTFMMSDLTEATFSISNIGVIGGTYASPVIVPPTVAIIAIGALKVVPKFDASNNVFPDEIVNISGAADHRIVDGATMAHFTNCLKKQIENPHLLFLNL